MTSRDFCYWLQGYFEISSMQGEIKISDSQARIIQAHLNLVFKHEIDPENFKNKSEKDIKDYEEIHKGAKSSTAFGLDSLRKDFETDSQVKFNC